MRSEIKPLATALDRMLDAQLVAARNDAEARPDSAARAAVEAGAAEHESEYQRLRTELLDALDAEHAQLLSRHANAGPMEVDGALAALQEFRVRRGDIERELVVLDGLHDLRGERRAA
jgi:hypothetical protein